MQKFRRLLLYLNVLLDKKVPLQSLEQKKSIWHSEILFLETYRMQNCIDAHWKEVMSKIYFFTGSWKQIFINSEACSYNLSMQLTEKR